MNFDIQWTKLDYQNFLDYLYSIRDEKYKNFHSKLILKNNLIGVRTPDLKRIAKEISKHDYKSFFKVAQNTLYEEKTIYGLVIGYLTNFDEMIFYLEKLFIHIDNWATCDLTCANLKIFKKNREKGLCYIQKLLTSNEKWRVRTGLVLLNNFYIDDIYIDYIFHLIDNVEQEEYYVRMATSWLISTCYIKNKEKTLNYLLNNQLNSWTHNKAIQKIKESKRVTEEEKINLEKLKK